MENDFEVPVEISRELVAENKYTKIETVGYRFHNEVIKAITKDGPEIVSVVPILNEDTILMIKQYRFVWGEWSWEIPSGHANLNEKMDQAAIRELEEETGYKSNKLTHRFDYLISAISPQPYHFYYAKELVKTEQNLDEEEQIEVYPKSIKEIKTLLRKNKIVHAPSIIALQDFLLNRK
ncbi:MAG: NUDIX hydrolase [Candidatus Ranarchaeia archaeon]